MNLLDQQYTKTPFYGVKRMTAYLRQLGYQVGEKRVRRLLRQMGLDAIYQHPNTSKPNSEHQVYPYLLRHVPISRCNQVWSTDITYIRLAKGFVYLMAVIDWYSRYVLDWSLSTTLTASQLIGLLRPLAPRLYSIASSQAEVGEEVHLTVGLLQFEQDGKVRKGAGSSYLAERVSEDTPVSIFIEKNDHFRLPQDNSTPIIMIGSGTGIAPFRAFVQQRAADEAEGKNWLIFGNQRFSQDFLYQTEWQQFAKDGYLHQYDFAWSRDQANKIYVQDKIRERAALIWQWLQNGAYVYVCGDASRMAKDVEKALLDVIAAQGKFTIEEAEEYLNELRENQRYQRDVY